MSKVEFLSRATNQIVDHYVETRKPSDRMISTGQAILAIRTALPNCELTDRQLTDLIAAAAIRSGRNVAFDAYA